MERIMITIPADLLRDVDSVAKRLKQDRSQLVQEALVEFLPKIKEQELAVTVGDLLSFAGIWDDMPEEEANALIRDIYNNRTITQGELDF